MPSASRSHKERIAREKALHTRVYISGLSGHHSLEVGLAYYYRGHYIYAYPAGNLIEPVPYSTRKGIMIQGIVSESAPGYDAKEDGLREEDEIRALEVSIEGEITAKEERGEGKIRTTGECVYASRSSRPCFSRADSGEALETSALAPPVGLGMRGGAEDLPATIISFAALRENALETFTPHHGAGFLAASAPGSRLASRAASPSGLRPISSHVGLARLGAIKEDTSPLVSRLAASVGYLYGLGDHALSTEDLLRLAEVGAGERIAPCSLHGEECDGVSTKEPWLTKRVMDGQGWEEELPMIERAGRVMMDWAGLLEEERVGCVQ